MGIFDDIIAAIPEYSRLPSIAEIEAVTDEMAEWPGVRVWTPGHSRAGRPIRCVEVGDGPRRVLLVGFPHPEEPVGALTLDHLLRLAAETDLTERLGVRLCVIRVADRDAALLNEVWFETPCDLEAYVAGAYRPPWLEQVEWTYPARYKDYIFDAPIPETRAVMAAIASAPLDFTSSLHNACFGGTFFYASDAGPRLVAELVDLVRAAGLPLHLGEPEAPFVPTLGPGIYREGGLAEEYDYYVSVGEDPLQNMIAGTGHSAYSRSVWPQCASLMSEVPSFTSSSMSDLSPAGMTRGEVQREGMAAVRGHVDWLASKLEDVGESCTQDTPWRRTVEGYIVDTRHFLGAQEKWLATEEASSAQEATVAQMVDYHYLREMYALFKLGQFARAMDAEPRPAAVVRASAEAARARLHERLSVIVAATGLYPVPLRTRVQVQLGTILAGLQETILLGS
jgi:hypothetical protein